MSDPNLHLSLQEIVSYFQSADATLPPLNFNDFDADGRMDLFDEFGNEYQTGTEEVPRRWAHLLRGIAINEQESAGIELSAGDWNIHRASLRENVSGKRVLPNGLQVFVEHNPDIPFVHFGFVAFTGSLDEPAAQRGISHGLEHVLVGSGPAGTRKNFADLMTEWGGEDAQANTSYQRTFYEGFIPPEQLARALPHYANMLMNEKYDLARVNDERNGVLSMEINRGLSNPQNQMWYRFIQKLSPNYPLGEKVTGTIEGIRALSLADFQAFHHNHYLPNNMAVRFHGPVTLQSAVQLMGNTVLGKAKSDAISRPQLAGNLPHAESYDIFPSGTNGVPEMATSTILVGWTAPPLQALGKDTASLDVALELLNRKLEEVLQKTGRASDVSADYGSSGAVGQLNVSMSVKSSEVEAALISFHQVLYELQTKATDEAEIESIRRKLVADKAFAEDVPSYHLGSFLEQSRYVHPDRIEEKRVEALKQVSAADLQEILQRYFPYGSHHTMIVLETKADPSHFPSASALSARIKAKRTETLHAADTAKLRRIQLQQPMSADAKIADFLVSPAQQLADGRVRYRLKNGVSVTLEKTKTGKLVSMTMRSPLGNATDPLGKEGLRALLKANLFRGTEDFSQEQFINEMSFLGAQYGASTNTEDFSFQVTAPAGSFGEAFELMLFAVRHPRLSDKDMDETRKALNMRRNALQDNYGFIAKYIPTANLYPNKVLVRPSLGNEQTLGAVTQVDLQQYLQQLLNPAKLEVMVAGNLAESDLLHLLSGLSLLPQMNAEKDLGISPSQSAARYPFDYVSVDDPRMRKALGVSENTIVTHTTRDIDAVYASLLHVGPPRDSWEFPYYLAFESMLGMRNFYRLVYGQQEGRPIVKGYLYKAWTNHDEIEKKNQVLGGYEFECEPHQIAQVLTDYYDEYSQSVGLHQLNQEEYRQRINGMSISWKQTFETTPGKVNAAIQQDNHPFYFKKADGSIEAVYNREEIYKRMEIFSLEDIIRIGGKYYDPKQAAHLHLVGRLPQIEKEKE